MTHNETTPPDPEDPEPQPAAKGRPRSEKTHQRILEATRQLAAKCELYSDISIEAISKEANVGKSTIYRWWENKSALFREACFTDCFVTPNTGALRSDILDIIAQEVAIFQDSMPRAVFAGFATEFAEIYHLRDQSPTPPQRMLVPILDAVLESARRRGEVVDHLDSQLIADHLEFVLFYKCITRGETVSRDAMVQLCEHVLHASSLTMPHAFLDPDEPE